MRPFATNVLRSLRSDPGASITAVLTLAAGITACVTVFSVADATLLRPLPYPRPERLAVVSDQLTSLNIADMAVAWPHVAEYRNQSQIFEETGAFAPTEFTLHLGSHSERVPGIWISPEVLPMLGVQPVLGRNIRPEESRAGQDRALLLSHAAWVGRFGGKPDVLGQSLNVDGTPREIIGVLPAGFDLRVTNGPRPEFYGPVPFDFDPVPKPPRVRVLARLKPGVTVEAANAQMTAIAARLSPAHVLYGGPRGRALGYKIGVTPLRDRLYGNIRRPMYLFCGAVALVLLISCVNVANLLLVRAQNRTREFAVRRALGAGVRHIVVNVLAESAALSTAATLIGIVSAYWAVRLLVFIGPAELADVRMDWRSAAFAALVALFAACAPAVLPVVRLVHGNVAESLVGGRTTTAAPNRRRTLKTLVAVEVALALVLLTGSALLLRSFANLHSTELGFEREHMITGVINLPPQRYKAPAQQADYYDRLLAAFRENPGVQAATLSSGLPLMMPSAGAPFVIEGRPFQEHSVATQSGHSLAVDGDFFKVLAVPLIAGRLFDERDTAQSTRVAVINETLARSFFPNDNPIGHRIVMGGPRPNAPWLTIIGVVKDIRMAGPGQRPLPQVYSSAAQWPSPYAVVTVRSRGEASAVRAELVRTASRVDPEAPVSDIRSMDERFALATSRPRFQTTMLASFAFLAVVLAVAGVVGVVAYSVAQRTKEIGIRLAVGASAPDVLRLMVRDGMKPVLIGAVAGILLCVYLSDLISSMLYETKPLDLLSYACAALLFIGVAAVACAIAARRAVTVDPVTALRVD